MPSRVVGDFGAPFAIQIAGTDLTLMDTVTVVIRKPDGTKVNWAPLTVTTDLITYTPTAADLDQDGVYAGEVVLTWGILVDPPGQTTSPIFSFTIDPGLL